MTTDQTDLVDKPITIDIVVGSIIDRFDACAGLDAYDAFSTIIAGLIGIRQNAAAGFGAPITADQHQRLTACIDAAYTLVASKVGPDMRVRVNVMFGAARFLAKLWKDRSANPIRIEGLVLQALALVRALEIFLEYTQLWARIDQITVELNEQRHKLFSDMLDVDSLPAGQEGTS